ncbi:MAG: hypothetical protein ACJAS3_000361 [Roseivirga sp.]
MRTVIAIKKAFLRGEKGFYVHDNSIPSHPVSAVIMTTVMTVYLFILFVGYKAQKKPSVSGRPFDILFIPQLPCHVLMTVIIEVMIFAIAFIEYQRKLNIPFIKSEF